MKELGDVLLIIAWMTVIAFGLPFNGWLIALSILYWFLPSDESFYKKEKESD